MAQIAKAQSVKKQTDHLGDPQEWNYLYPHSYVQTNKHMYDWILLDTCSSINLFCNQALMHNVHQVDMTLSLVTNARTMTTNLKSKLPGYGTVWFDPQAMTNVLSFGNIALFYIYKNWIHF